MSQCKLTAAARTASDAATAYHRTTLRHVRYGSSRRFERPVGMSAITSQASLHVGMNSELFGCLKTTIDTKNERGPREEIFRKLV